MFCLLKFFLTFFKLTIFLQNINFIEVRHNSIFTATLDTLNSIEILTDSATSKNSYSKCNLFFDSGPCRANISMFYFNQTLNKCLIFEYGGCNGNANRFFTIKECEKSCLDFNHKSFDNKLMSRQKRFLRESEMSIAYPIPNSSFYFVESPNSSILTNVNTDIINDLKLDNKLYQPENLSIFINKSNEIEMENILIADFSENLIALPELCLLIKEPGSCFGKYLRWYYNSEINKCTSFHYTGCQANANHFSSLEACDRACGIYRTQPVCNMLYDVGNCFQANFSNSLIGARSVKWFYNYQQRQCYTFMWSGCGGNGNRFSSKADCEDLCSREFVNLEDINSFEKQSKRADICYHNRDSGPCTDSVTQWFYYAKEKECRQFTYGGCRGNANRFNTKPHCERSCQLLTSINKNFFNNSLNNKTDLNKNTFAQFESLAFKEICTLPFIKEPCNFKSQDIYYYFDSLSATCRLFNYGECGGNSNRFKTEEDCHKTCKNFSLNNNKYHQKQIETNFVLIEASQPSPYLEGKNVDLKCIHNFNKKTSLNTELHFKWYKNKTELIFNNSQRFKILNGGQILQILLLNLSDNGDYSCSINDKKIISSAYTIIVQKGLSLKDCKDLGTFSTCMLIKRTGLCASARYGKFCCMSCTKT